MSTSNLILKSLSPKDFKILEPQLKPVDLPQGKILFDPGDAVDAVYFPQDAVVSLVVPLSTGEMIEAAMVGRDGVVAASAAMDGKVSLSRAIVQIGGKGVSCSADVLKK